MKKLILASASPRRRELLQQAGYEFQILPAKGEEVIHSQEPAQIVKELSAGKAAEIAKRIQEGELPTDDYVILGADTIVVMDGAVLGKPRDEQEALRMLTALQGRTHQVYTGVTMQEIHGTDCSDKSKEKEGEMEMSPLSFAVCTEVDFSPASPEEIHRYIATGEPMDKAGAYGIQGAAAVFIREIRGDYANVVGLPLHSVYEALSSFGIQPSFVK